MNNKLLVIHDDTSPNYQINGRETFRLPCQGLAI